MYRVKFWNPANPGKGFIESYKRADQAKAIVAKYNMLFARDGKGVRAEYLGKRDRAA